MKWQDILVVVLRAAALALLGVIADAQSGGLLTDVVRPVAPGLVRPVEPVQFGSKLCSLPPMNWPGQ